MVYTEEERKERRKLYNLKYNNKNREKKQEINKIYRKTETGKKSICRDNWKRGGLNMENFEEIYQRYKDAIFCDICECVLEGIGYNQKCMDHDHDSGDFRNIVCRGCNIHICK